LRTAYSIYRPGCAESERGEVQWPVAPGRDLLHTLMDPILGTCHLEHVSVLYNGRPADMFADERGRIKRLRRNEAATAIYRSAWLGRHPGAMAEDLPWIAGTAVLFDRVVWG
jgi:hypothetical protein